MYDISVIIPTFNASDLIWHTLDSVNKQTFNGLIEIICIDDASTDNTVDIIKKYREDSNLPIRILRQHENEKQGAARNRGLKHAKGDYIFFLDADDFLSENTFEVMYNKAQQIEDCDFVLCDWTYFYEDEGEVYVNNDLFLYAETLKGADCERLFQAESYFTVNKLYKKSFLIENNILYGEGYIYEDLEFYADTVQHANTISIVSNPFYKVRVNDNSTTKSNYNTTVHMEDFLTAVTNSLKNFRPRHKESYYMFYKYLLFRAQLYSEKRVPKRYKKQMITETVKILNNKNTKYYVPKNIVLFNQLYFQKKLVQNNKINSLMLVRRLVKNGKLDKYYKNYLSVRESLYKILFIEKLKQSNLNKWRRNRNVTKLKEKYKNAPLLNNSVLFLGFDYRYVGNSKYFFEYLRSNHTNLKISFVTDSEAVPLEHRIKPRSLEFWKALGESKVIIAESWVPLPFYKKEGAIWIQLWHGTPYKKLLFDSHEKHIAVHNRNHKRNKKRDISKWDYLLADSNGGAEKFKTAFSIPDNMILSFGYPRVQWLKDNNTNKSLKGIIKKPLKIPANKKVLLYAPTWRDYNYKKNNPNLNYLINLDKLANELAEEYVIIAKLHPMEMKFSNKNKNIIFAKDYTETQELLLIADIVISDYSSIIFDALPLDKPIFLYINDKENYERARGCYPELDDLLEPFKYKKTETIIQNIMSKSFNNNHQNYRMLKSKYSHHFSWNSNGKLATFLNEKLKSEIID